MPRTVCASLESNYPVLLFEEATFTGNVAKERAWGRWLWVQGTQLSVEIICLQEVSMALFVLCGHGKKKRDTRKET